MYESENVCPIGYGGEEEASFKYLKGPLVPGEDLKVMLRLYRNDPAFGIISHGVHNEGKMDSTGGGLYVDRFHMEIATPEYTNIAELLARLESHENIEAAMAVCYLRKYSHIRGIGVNRRVRDYVGNTFGIHDSFGLLFAEPPTMEALREGLRPYLTAHFLTRPFMTGAGLVTDNKLHFSQKLAGAIPPTAYKYTFTNSLYRFTEDEGGVRFESRDNDVNILGAWLRVGSTALAQALARTPKFQREFKPITAHFSDIKEIPRLAHAHNAFSLRDDGQLVVSEYVRAGMEFQLLQAEAALEELPKYVYVPPELLAVAERWRKYAKVALTVAAGDAPIKALDDLNSDWAAKFGVIQRRIARDREAGKTRTLRDETAQRDDLGYDFIQVRRDPEADRSDPNAIKVEKVGYGYRLRDRRRVRYEHDFPAREAVATAATTAPQDTRAGLRASLLREYIVIGGTWRALKMQPTNPNGGEITLQLPWLHTTTLPASEEPKLALVRRRPAPASQTPA